MGAIARAKVPINRQKARLSMWRIWTRGWGIRSWWWWVRNEGFWQWIAFRLPRRIAYWAFIRVHAEGEMSWTFAEVADHWENRVRR